MTFDTTEQQNNIKTIQRMLDELVTDSNPQAQLRHSIAIQALNDLANQIPLASVSGSPVTKIERLKHIRTAQQAVNDALNPLITEAVTECIEDQKDSWKATNGRKVWRGRESEIADVILQAIKSNNIDSVYENIILGLRYVCGLNVRDTHLVAGGIEDFKTVDDVTAQRQREYRQDFAFNKSLLHLKAQLLINKIRADVNMTEHPNTFSTSTPTAKNDIEQILVHMSEEWEGQSYEADFTIVMHIDSLRGRSRPWVDDEVTLLTKMIGQSDYGWPQTEVDRPHFKIAAIYEEDEDKLTYATYSTQLLSPERRLESDVNPYIYFESFNEVWHFCNYATIKWSKEEE